jgi:hypothetical protein
LPDKSKKGKESGKDRRMECRGENEDGMQRDEKMQRGRDGERERTDVA